MPTMDDFNRHIAECDGKNCNIKALDWAMALLEPHVTDTLAPDYEPDGE